VTPLEARFAAWEDKRSCGRCTMCCYVFEVAAVPTRGYEWCKHCAVGVGCRIYAARPPECASFYCLWRMGFGTDEDRPDRHGVVMDLQVESGEAVIRVWRPKQLQVRKLRSATRMLREVADALTADGYVVRAETHGPKREERHASEE